MNNIIELIVGIGNPGKCFVNTRHNIGTIFIKKYLQNCEILNCYKHKNYILYKVNYKKKIIYLFMSNKYVNETGFALKECIKYYKFYSKQILIVYDDLDLPLGISKLKYGCNSSHNGIKNILPSPSS